MAELETGKPTIVEGAKSNPYLITQAVRYLGSDRRITELVLKGEDVVIFSDPKSASDSLVAELEPKYDQAPFTSPYSPFSSWNPEK